MNLYKWESLEGNTGTTFAKDEEHALENVLNLFGETVNEIFLYRENVTLHEIYKPAK